MGNQKIENGTEQPEEPHRVTANTMYNQDETTTNTKTINRLINRSMAGALSRPSLKEAENSLLETKVIRTELLAHAINQSQQIPISTLLKTEKLLLHLEVKGPANQKHLWSEQL